MTNLHCPYCGSRELEEFAFRKTLPEPDTDDVASVYLRTSRLESSVEHWQHLRGCRAWLKVCRNPSTGEIHEIELLGGFRS